MEKPPRYVSCPCQHCDGNIEFDANGLVEENSVVPCPHCGLETNIFIPIGQTEKVPTELPSSVAKPNAVRREGFFCGTPFSGTSEMQQEHGSEGPPVANAPKLTGDQIKSIGERQNDDMALKLNEEGEQNMMTSFDDARRYIADPRFKLMDPETGLRFTPTTLEAFIKAKQRQKKIEADLPKEPQAQNLTPPTDAQNQQRIIETEGGDIILPGKWMNDSMSEKQKAMFVLYGITAKEGLTKGDASKLIDEAKNSGI